MSGVHLIERLRSSGTRARTVAAVITNVLLCEVGARVGLPGVDGSRVRDFIQSIPRGGLLGLYNLAVGGALSRAAIFALGAVPYLQARLYLWLARGAFPRLRQATEDSAAQRSVVRIATVGLACVQSFGFARFLQTIPGAVAVPGAGFITRTVLLATAGAAAVSWLADLTVSRRTTSDSDHVPDEYPSPANDPQINRSSVPSTGDELSETPVVPLLEPGSVLDGPRRAAPHVEISIGRSNER
jgi:hypothetical protein